VVYWLAVIIVIKDRDSSEKCRPELQSKDCGFEPHYQQGCLPGMDLWQTSHFKLLVWLQNTMVKIMEVPTSGCESKSLNDCQKSTSPFSLKITESLAGE